MRKNRFLVAVMLFATVCTTMFISCKKVEPITYTLTVLSNNEEMGTVTGGGTYVIGTEATLTATPTSEEYVFVKWNDGNINSQRVIKVIADETYTAYFDARPSTGSDMDTEDNHEWVDLGLSVKWATCNVGASKPEEYGNYYAWGETEPKETYDWSTYKLTADGGSTFTKYNTTDGKTTLELTDDAAHVNWGGTWRIPTLDECKELIDNCIWTWTDNYNGTGVAGQLVTASNGESIFLPAAGLSVNHRNGTEGFYWSSSLNTDYLTSASLIHFVSGSKEKNDLMRYYGFPIRAVTE